MSRARTLFIIVGFIILIAVVIQAATQHWIVFMALLLVAVGISLFSIIAQAVRKDKGAN